MAECCLALRLRTRLLIEGGRVGGLAHEPSPGSPAGERFPYLSSSEPEMLQRFFKSLFEKPARKPVRVRRGLRLEALEARWVPTVTSVLANGVLTLTETGGSSDTVTITETATPGSYATTGTTNDGTFTNVTSIVANLGTGTDSLTLNGDATANNLTALTGNLDVTQGGTLTVDIGATTPGFNVFGAATINHTSANPLTLNIGGASTSLGSLTVFDGDGASTTNVLSAAGAGPVIEGFVSLNLGAGASTTTITGATVGGFFSLVGTAGDDQLAMTGTVIGGVAGAPGTPAPNLGIDVGAGQNTINIGTTSAVGNLFVFSAGSGAAADQFNLTTDNIKGFVTYNKTAGASAVQSVVSNTNIGGFLSYVSVGGDDQVTFQGSTLAGVASNGAAGVGNFGMALGAGTNSLNVTAVAGIGSSIQGDLFFGAFAGIAATGTDTFTVDSTTVFGTVSVNNGASTGIVTVNIGAAGVTTTIGSALSIVTGTAADVINVNNTTVIRNTAIVAGDGANITNIAFPAGNGTSTFLGNFSYLGGAGIDTLNLGATPNTEEARFAGTVTLDGGAGADVLTQAGADYLGGPAPTITSFP